MKAALYARVSTTDKGQDPDLQLRELRRYAEARGWQIAGEYVDVGQSGAKDRRPELDRLMDDARKRRVDLVLVWKLDRFGRSLRHLVNSLGELDALGVGFVSFSESIDLTTPAGRLMCHLLAAFAQFERDLIRERVKAGISNARAKGKAHGRRSVFPETRLQDLADMRGRGMSIRAIAEALGASTGCVHQTLRKLALKTPEKPALEAAGTGVHQRDVC